ncbi:MAG: DUF1289 domain-containing protein [Methylotenera sp.]|nr:DUF1289 domain-containing protein [Methylotenera sp.]MDO9232456.1 DUF1289 domain-containing protein [Methylotenera sp.]MDO9389892.1 DUF1289 domain-containing protein [Methylotenera sp.]MDP1596288.1 DUF1289 domain-containing protein [Methylotenera sp.]MDP1755102.1 DUF1289 domain-containing protein [Methylotenera sp.]
MSEDIKQEIQSPCIGVCSMDDTTGYCHGCYRTISEIKAWWDLNPDDQKNLLTTLNERQLKMVNFD